MARGWRPSTGTPRQPPTSASAPDDCRIMAQAEDESLPLAGPPRPTTRTTEDYLRERDELRKLAAEAGARVTEKKNGD